MKVFSVFDSYPKKDHSSLKSVFFPFVKDNQELDYSDAKSPFCGLSLFNAGSMRFRWNETNENRNAFFDSIGIDSKKIVPVELIHSKKVFTIDEFNSEFINSFAGSQGDGLLSQNLEITLSVTVADCMPIFLWEPKSGAFAVLHSGWKGTGIVEEGIKIAVEKYGCNVKDFCVVLGPHIRSCCYSVDKERSEYFTKNFCLECINESFDSEKNASYNLSLSLANLSVLKKIGVKDENIAVCRDCTSCNPLLGSYRREYISLLPNSKNTDPTKAFTPMAAFCGFKK